MTAGGRRRRAVRPGCGVRLGRPALVAVAAVALAACGSAAPDESGRRRQPPGVPDTVGPPVADPGAVRARIRAALAATGTYRGTMVTTGPGGRTPVRFDFVVGSDGSHRVAHADGWHAFDAGRGELTVFCRAHDAVWAVVGLPPAPTGRMPPTGLGALSQSEPGGLARLAVELGGPVLTTTHDGRPAWRFEGPQVAGRGADHVVVVVDAATGLGVKRETFRDGRAVGTLRVDGLVVDGPAGLGSLDLDPPPASSRRTTLDGGSRVREEAAPTAGAYLPGWVPDGFVAGHRMRSADARWPELLVRAGLLAAVTSDRLTGGTERCHTPPLADGSPAFPADPAGVAPGPGAVGVTYRRGFESFTVSTASHPDGRPGLAGTGAGWEPLPLGTAGDARLSTSTTRSGPIAEIWVPPHLVTVAGDLTRAELVRVADSLVPGG